MSMRQGSTVSIALLLGGLASVQAGDVKAATSSREPADRAVSGGRIEEVVVQARKILESAQDVPVSMTAATGDSLRDQGYFEFQDIAKIAPNLDIRPGSVTGSSYASITMRGQSGTFHTLNADQAVGLYVNGAPYSRATGFFTTMFDIERVEVLRGPQGTLYGRNTTGGAINVYTNAPNHDGVDGYAEVTVGDYDQFDVQGAINLPVVPDRLAVRLAAARTKRDGFGVGSITGQELADDDELFVRASVLVEPTDLLSIRINADYHESDEAGPIFRSLRSVNLGSPAAPFPLAVESTGDFFTGNAYGIEHTDDLEEHNVNATVELALEAVTLTSVTAFRDFEVSNSNQTNPVVAVTMLGQEAELFTQEFRISGAAIDDRLTWQAGMFYSDESGTDTDLVAIFSNQITKADNRSWAAFTQSTLAITDRLDLTAGVRYSWEEKELRDLGLGIEDDETFSDWSWLVALDQQLTDAVMIYASASRGFRSGAIDQDNIGNTVRPETVDSYEIGVKSDLFDDRLRANLAAFYSDYQDIQRTAFLPDSILTGIRNAAAATITGFEAELTAMPIDSLTLGAAIAHLDASYDKYVVGTTDRSDDSFSQPEWTLTLTARYETAVGTEGMLGVQANYYWQDEIDFGTVVNRPLLTDEQLRLDDYGLLNAQIDFSSNRWPGLHAALFAHNLTDERHFTTGFNGVVFGNAFANRYVGNPRTWGARVRLDF